jgi:PPP family 3-phenylpropionic acid transporter
VKGLGTISLVWFFVLGGLGIWFPYISLYLGENAGLSGSQIGWVLAMIPLAGLVAQPLWGQVADRTGLRTRVLFLLGAGAACGYLNLYFAHSFPALLLGTAALALFSSALIPTCVSVTLAISRDLGAHAFGRARVWGTVGFLIVVYSAPRALHALQQRTGLEALPEGPSEPGLQIMFPVTATLVLVGALFALALPRSEALGLRAPSGDWRLLLRHGPFLRLLGFSLVAYLCLQGPMSLFPLFVRAHGGSMESVSDMWILMLMLEIPLIWASGAGLERLGPRGLLAVGVLAGGLRWAVCGFADDMRWIYPVQLLHGVVVAGLVIGGPLYVDSVVPERLRSTGQGLLAMVGVSLGGISSQLSSGWLLEHMGSDAPYLAGGIGALILGLSVPLVLAAPTRTDGAPPSPASLPSER